MERQVIFRDRQELPASDLTNVQVFADETHSHIVSDAITPERQIVGLEVKMHSATEIEVSPGRLWDGTSGKVYRKDEAEVISVFSYLPLQDKKILSVAVIGQEEETDIQPRDFVIDVQTKQTEPRAVAMELRRTIAITIVSGEESPDPQAPAVPTGYTEIAQVVLDPSGIVEIRLAENKKLPRLFETDQRLKGVESWKEIAEKRVSTLASDIANIAKKLFDMEHSSLTNQLAADVARLKDLMNLPDTYSSYGADRFLTDDESDTQNTEYYARAEEGIRFPWAGEYEFQPDLFNPYDPAVKKYESFIIPDFDEEVRLETKGYAGELSISQYQYQTFGLKEGKISIVRKRYGKTRRVCTNHYGWRGRPEDFLRQVLHIDPTQVQWQTYGRHGPYYWIRINEGYWEDRLTATYYYPTIVTHTINGSQIAQTFLNSQNGWLTKVGFYFTKVAQDGVVYLAICETHKGMPDPSKTLILTSLEPSEIKKYPEETIFTLPRPVFLTAGKRYAFILITAGDHAVATVSGQEYTEGTLFYSMDGEYYQGDFTKDLMMKLYYAKFKNTFVTVELTPASLSDGIADIDITLNAIEPENTELIVEYQYNGKWYPVAPETVENFAGLPAMLPLRLRFVGSTTLMPAVDFQGSKVRVARPATTFTHISTERELPTASITVDVQVLLEHFDENKHTCEIHLVDPDTGTNYTPDVVEDKYDPFGIRRVATFNNYPNSKYKIKIQGTTTTALEPFLVAERIDIAY